MSCKCVEKAEKKLAERYGEGYLDATISGNVPAVRYYYHRKKKDGTFEAKERNIPVIAVFCPFCGEAKEGA